MTKIARRDAQTAVPGPSIAKLQEQLDIRTRERDEALEQQTATAEVLKVISSSTGKLEPVFQTILENSITICEAKFGMFWLTEGHNFRCVALHGTSPAFTELRRREPIFHPNPILLSPLGRIARSKQLEQVADCRAEQAYIEGEPGFVALVDLAGARTILVVPILRDNELVGALNIFRQEVRPFTDKQIELVQNFAAQAVIAIENTRLLNELHQRTDDLTESLEQQTATSEILKVISNSPTDTQPAFDVIVRSGLNLFPDSVVAISLPDRDLVKLAAIAGADKAGLEALRGRYPMPLSHEFITGTAILNRCEIDLADAQAPPKELTVGARNLLAGGYRAMTVMPMMRGDETIGTLNVVRRHPGPLSDKQRELLRTFAKQAVIAIENTRLFNELRESLERQTATSEVLKVISGSSGKVEPVFDAMLANATRICDAAYGAMWLREDGKLRNVAFHGVLADAFSKLWKAGSEIPFDSNVPIARAVRSGKLVIVQDLKDDTGYREGQPLQVAAVDLGGIRSLVAVPMMKDGEHVGGITIYRLEVRPFTEKQIELVQNFAAQAVIAIENTRLLNELRQRTADLTQSLEELRATQDRLVQTEKLASLGQLTAGIAHEIKNPLNFVNNFSGISAELIGELQDTLSGLSIDAKAQADIKDLTDTLRGNLEKVVQHGKRADAIVKSMLLHSGETSGQHQSTDINALVEESLNRAYYNARAEQRGFTIKLERSFDPAAGEAELFPREITRALLNLISNGFYAAAKRNAEIKGDGHEPTLAAATKNLGDRVEIRIRDNGTGIPADVKEKMFDPFFTTKPAGEGTGLGLSISHDIIVKQHGGSIEVDTKAGEFAEIRVILPRASGSV
jgi:GAF domain-containing protein